MFIEKKSDVDILDLCWIWLHNDYCDYYWRNVKLCVDIYHSLNILFAQKRIHVTDSDLKHIKPYMGELDIMDSEVN